MSTLSQMHCVSPRGDEPTLSEAQIYQFMPQVPEWQIKEMDGEKCLERTFKFKDFGEALAFTDKVGAIAQAEDHHPRIVTEWGKVVVDWWTHKIHGLHQNDFIMAARTDQLVVPQKP